MFILSVEVSLNELNLRTGNEFTFKSGEFISLSISLYNCSGISLKSLNLVIHCYQDYQNSHKIGKERNYRLEMKRALTGFDRVFIPEVLNEKNEFLLNLKIDLKFKIFNLNLDSIKTKLFTRMRIHFLLFWNLQIGHSVRHL